MTQPLVTIVIPVHNRASLVERTLWSVETQTHRPLAVVLVDNASTDGTRQVLERWADTVRADDLSVMVISEDTPGATAARNAGLDQVRTPWTMFFDSDDIMAPDHVARLADAVADNPDADIVGWDVRLRFLDWTTVVKPFASRRLFYNCIIHGTMATQRYAARTGLFRRAGGWDPDVAVWNDIELGVRLLRLRPNIVRLGGAPTVEVCQSVVSVTGPSFHSGAAGRELSLRRMSEAVPPAQRRWVRVKRALLAGAYAREGYTDDGRRLLASNSPCSLWQRMWIRMVYAASRRGIRGAATIASYFI